MSLCDGNENSGSAPAGAAWFATTHWSVVLAPGDGASPRAGEAMDDLCRTYWYPLYAYVRRKGYPAPDAQDLTQEFFARLLAARNEMKSEIRRDFDWASQSFQREQSLKLYIEPVPPHKIR